MADGITATDVKNAVIELVQNLFDVVTLVFKVIRMFK